MPISKYDRYFGGKRGSAAKAKASIEQHYGDPGVFYAMVNKQRASHRGTRPARTSTEHMRRRGEG